jgi:citrate lyase gamma subunit
VAVKIYKIQIKDTEEAATGDNVSIIVNTDVDSAIENIDTFENSLDATTTFQAAHYFNSVKAPAGGVNATAEYQVSEVLVVGDGGTNVFESEFGIVTSGTRQLLTYTTDYDNTTARLRATGAVANTVVNGYRVNLERKGGGISAASAVLNSSDQSIQGLKTFTSGIATDDITSPSSNANITLDPAGTGKIDLAGNTILKDSVELQFGTDADANMKHTGTNLNINETTGDINIRTYADNKDVVISTDDSSGGITEYIVADGSTGAVKLKHYGTTVFETTSTGVSIENTSTSDALLITTTEDSSSAGPVINLKRNSSSPANADYLGQIKFQGENDADQEVLYAKISGKILDVGDGTEDGILEFAFKKNGSNNISGRFRSDSLQLLNDTSLRVTGHVELGVLSGDPSGTTNIAHIYAKDESSSAEVFVRDEAGNVTKISPHNEQGEWEYYSRNTKTGKTVRVNMEEMIRDIEQLTGKTYIQNI